MEFEPISLRLRKLPLGRLCALVFLLACAVRVVPFAAGKVPRDWLMPETRSEIGRVARELAETGRFANGYLLPTGATAHPAPVWTFLLAGLYRLFGFTLAAGVARALLGIASFAATAAAIPWLAVQAGLGRRAGLVAGLAAALVPFQGPAELLGWSGHEPLAALSLAALLVGSLRRWNGPEPSAGSSLGLGAAWGASFHVMPALLPVMLACGVFELFSCGARRRASAVALLALAAALACVPWGVRNWMAFHEPLFVRSNFGLELRLGNHEGAEATIEALDAREGDAMRHPGVNAAEARLVAELGEVEYMRRARTEALEWITAHPREFLRLSATRAFCFWFGSPRSAPFAPGVALVTLLAALGAWRAFPALTTPQRAALLLPLATYPLVHYVVPHMVRYTAPIFWILLLLAACAFVPPRHKGASHLASH